jgi:predicted enzyme related to lactoylglutathione lyase
VLLVLSASDQAETGPVQYIPSSLDERRTCSVDIAIFDRRHVVRTPDWRSRQRRPYEMAHPVVHAEIRSANPDATRKFYADLFGWKVASEGAFPGFTFIDTGAEGRPYVAISPRQSDEDEVLFFVAVEDVPATLKKAQELGGKIVQPAQEVPGTTFAVFADAQGHKVGVASNN